MLQFKTNLILLVLSIMSWSATGVAQANEVDVKKALTEGTFYLFTEPVNCGFCMKLDKKLKESGQQKVLKITYEGVEYPVTINKLNPWDSDPTPYYDLGYQDHIPHFSIVLDEKVIGLGTLDATPIGLTLNRLGDKLLPLDAETCLLYTSPSPRDRTRSRMPSSA